ncbi:hypothetical protein HPB52_003859 [Rhipicephalus sanguineus]|uniref:Secreted protein n=1 Tax=Rhipicephalus sanguineus TaxID=34632 RepID=A0A9D4QAY0_RHISA|nr:hypothetical protein HPB52_003859 [Rhipicephalus sanguineus]
MVFRTEIAVVYGAAALVAVLHLCAAGVSTCTSDSDCSGGQRCVEHFNMSVNANCDSYKYCLKQSDQYPACGPNSIATLYGTEYSCDGCRSASSVLVAPN